MAEAFLTVDPDGTILRHPGYGKLWVAGTTVPADGEVGFARGCIFQDVSGDNDPPIFVNDTGTRASCNFDRLDAL